MKLFQLRTYGISSNYHRLTKIYKSLSAPDPLHDLLIYPVHLVVTVDFLERCLATLTLSSCPRRGIHFFINILLCYFFLRQKFVLLAFTLLNIHACYQAKGADQTKRHEEIKNRWRRIPVIGVVNNCTRNKWTQERWSLANNSEKGEKEELSSAGSYFRYLSPDNHPSRFKI